MGNVDDSGGQETWGQAIMAENRRIRMAVVGTGQRASCFTRRFKQYEDTELAGLCDQSPERLQAYARAYGCEGVPLFTNLDEMLAGDRVDAVVVTVPDSAHREVSVRCFKAGKHVMLEKPMALTARDCRAIIRAKEKSGRILQIGFVMRSAPFYKRIREVLDEGRLGQVMGIGAAEYLSVGHSASYMRRWHRKSANSGGFILTKCSHDLDMLNWLSGSRPVRVASFGANDFFLPSKRPATHCSVCKMADCRFRYDLAKGNFVFMTEEDRANPSKRDFDLCVYNDDKDVVDNQVAILEYANGIRATFSLQLFRARGGRCITISGTEGYLTGYVEDNRFSVRYSRTGRVEEFPVDASDEGHAGADERFVREFVDAVKTGAPPVADLSDGLASTVVGVAIEKARLSGAVVRIAPEDYRCR